MAETTTPTPTKSGYVAGGDLILSIGGKPVGHCTSHSITINSETKERAVKPLGTEALKAAKFKEKGVVGVNVSISAQGLAFYAETEYGYKSCLAAVSAGEAVAVKCYERKLSSDTADKVYLEGNFVITSLEQSAAMGEDATYSISLENTGEVKFTESNLS